MENKFIKAMLIHLGTNMWYEEGNMQKGGKTTWFAVTEEWREKLFEAIDVYKGSGI